MCMPLPPAVEAAFADAHALMIVARQCPDLALARQLCVREACARIREAIRLYRLELDMRRAVLPGAVEGRTARVSRYRY